jgi:hypothetical protein
MTKHDTETAATIGARETYGVPPIPDALRARFEPPSNDPATAIGPIESGVERALTFATDVNNDGIFIGNMWRPILFDDTRNLPYEHPTRHEWDTPRYDHSFLNLRHELLPTGWSPLQYRRFRTWEFGLFMKQLVFDYSLNISWKAFHGIYDPKLFFFGCNAGWLEPDTNLYPLFREFAPGSVNPITVEFIQKKYDERRQQAMRVERSIIEYEAERQSISNPEIYEVKAYANPAYGRVAGHPGFHWKYPSYEKLKMLKPPGDEYFPRLNLCDEQYEWEQSVYDQPELDFSAEPTLRGYTRLQFLRRRAWEKSGYEHRVAKLTGKRNKPLEPVVSQSVIEKLQTNN